MDKLRIKWDAEDIIADLRMIDKLTVLKNNGIEYDIFEEEPLWEDDQGKVEDHIEFYKFCMRENAHELERLVWED